MEEEQKKSNLEVAIASAQLIILAYSTATAIQGIYKMGNNGMDRLYTLYKQRVKKPRLKVVS